MVVDVSAGGNEVECLAYIADLDEAKAVAEGYAAFFVEGGGCAA